MTIKSGSNNTAKGAGSRVNKGSSHMNGKISSGRFAKAPSAPGGNGNTGGARGSSDRTNGILTKGTSGQGRNSSGRRSGR